MTARLLVSVRRQETQIALWSRDRLLEFRIEREGAESRVGNVYLGRVVRSERGLDAAFVELGEPRPGFLPLGEFGQPCSEGAAVLVQVARDAREGKGPRLTRPRLAGRLLLYDPNGTGLSFSERIEGERERQRLTERMKGVPPEGGGFVLRRAATGADGAALMAEAAGLRARWQAILGRSRGARPPQLLYRDDPVLQSLRDSGDVVSAVVVDSRRAAEELQARCADLLPAFADRIIFEPQRDWVPGLAEIQEEVDAALEAEVPLPSGGFLLFEPGRTLTAIDVNSGSHTGDSYGRAGAERALLRTNIEAADEIARQLRLRNLGGILVVDFVNLASRAHRRQIVEALRTAVTADPMPCRVGTMSPLGLVEMTRRRRGPSLAEALSVPCGTCAGRGRVRRGTAADGMGGG